MPEIRNFEQSKLLDSDTGYPFDNKLDIKELSKISNFIIYRFFVKEDKKYDNEYAIFEASTDENAPHVTVRTTSQVLIKQLKENQTLLPMRMGLESRETRDGQRSYWTFREP